MSPPLACVPVCFFFSALGLIGVIAFLAGWGGLGGEEPAVSDRPAGPRPPWWVAVVVLAVVSIGLLVLSFFTEG